MAANLLIYFTGTEHEIYRWTRGSLELEGRFAADENGVAEFAEYLRGRPRALYYVLADIAGEDFHEDLIPYLRGNDREMIVQRRLAQRYRDTRLATALSLGTISGERRDERLLLASFTNTQQFTPWLDALAESDSKLAGVYSTPLLAPALAARLGARGGRTIVVTLNRAGLRQCFVDGGQLRFARLERTVEMGPESLAAFVRSEMLRLVNYLTALRALPREGPPVSVIVVAPQGHRAAFDQVLVSDARLSFSCVDAAQAAKAVGLKHAPSDALAESLYLHLAVKRRPKEQFARSEDRRGFLLWQLKRGVLAAGALGFAACMLFAGIKWLDIMQVRDSVALQQREAALAAQEYQRITAAFPVTQTSTDNLRTTVVEFRKIAGGTSSPEPAFVYLSRVLEQFPQIEIETLVWSVGRPGDERRASGAGGARPAAARDVSSETSEIVEISGRVNATQRTDYRAITAQVQQFAEALRSGAAYQLLRTQLPFDVSSEGTLTGDIGTPDAGEAPRFTIALARKLK